MIDPSRRRFLMGAGFLLAAPAIIRVASLMPVSVIAPSLPVYGFGIYAGVGKPHFTAPHGSLYMNTATQELLISIGSAWLSPPLRSVT